MSKTPRTDEHLRMKEENGHLVVVSADFARQLETELAEKDRQLAEARAEIERLKGVVISQITPEPVVLSSYSTSTEPAKDERDKLIEQMRDALESIKCRLDVGNCSERSLRILGKIVKAALAAERGE